MRQITASGTITALSDGPVPPLQLEGDPSILAQLLVTHYIPPHLIRDGTGYKFTAEAHTRSYVNWMQAGANTMAPEPVDTLAITFTKETLHGSMARELARLFRYNEIRVIDHMQLTVDVPPVMLGEPVVASERKSPPLSVWDVNRIMRKHAEFQETALKHIGAGSPAKGINDSFMTRCALIGLRDAVIDVLEKS